MKTYLKLAVAAAVIMAGANGAVAQKKAAAPAAMERIGGKPNLNGIWQVMNTANWNLEPHDSASNPNHAADRNIGTIGAIVAGLGVVEGGMIPYNDAGKAKKAEISKNLPAGDPEAACYLPGIPRATYMPYPFQIIQADNGDMLFVYEYASANRVIKMGPVGIPPIDTWMGTSYGEWEGDTLKVVTLALSPGDVIMPGGDLVPGVTWLDRAGNFLTNTATVTERFTMTDATHMTYEVTVSDPSVYTKDWKMTMPIYKNVEKNAQLLDFRCVPFSEQFLYGDLLEDKDAKK